MRAEGRSGEGNTTLGPLRAAPGHKFPQKFPRGNPLPRQLMRPDGGLDHVAAKFDVRVGDIGDR